MSITHRIRQFKDNVLLRGLSDPNHWLSRFVQQPASSGVSVTADSSLKVAAVYACVKVLAETIASLPLTIYERVGSDGKKPATGYPLYPILHDAPNAFMTSFDFRESQMAHLCLRGESYARIVRNSRDQIEEMLPLNPARMDVAVANGLPVYVYRYEDGKQEPIPREQIWHVKHLPISCTYNGDMPEGYRGVSPIQVARESIGLSMAADQYGGRFFANNASVGMALKFPAGVKLSENAKTFLKESLAEYGKLENKFKSIVLEDGGDLSRIGMSNEDSQFLESRQFGVEEIARIFRVPPIMIGHPTNTMTYASAEQLFLSFATFTIRPWCVRIEQSINRNLIAKRDQGKYFAEFNLAGLLRGDLATRYAAYAVARQWGWMSVDEIRSLENMNPLPDAKGQEYLVPLNMIPAGEEHPAPKPAPQTTKDQGGEGDA